LWRRRIAPPQLNHFQSAIQLDPNFALAYDGLGASYVIAFLRLRWVEDFQRAEVAFKKALELDPNLVEATMLMIFCIPVEGRKQKARDEVSRMRRRLPTRRGALC